MKRSLAIESVNKIGETILVQGWVHSVRAHGKVTFFDLRDRSGLLQVVSTAKLILKPESVVAVEGQVVERGKNYINDKLATGTVELQASSVEIISLARELPLPIDTDGHDIDESVRLKYRYLDLRRPRMHSIIRLKSKATQIIRNYLHKEDFVEIDTPILTKSTPEGARDFLVPSRLQPGKFYALPQSPQQYKQLLMVAGFERYFQFARCFRDEDPRKDRAYGEFTQLDLEMSFITQEDIINLTEKLFTQVVETLFPTKKISQSPWPRLPHREAVSKYGTDKPDLRKDKNDPDELAFSWTIDFPLFTAQSDEDFFHGSGSAKFAPSHHMFTAPHPDDIPLLDTDPTKVRGLQHDLVLNGYEVGGGSIRIHQREVQEKIFELIGFSAKQKQEFAHMLEAFTYGVPPHGGIAPGLDRFLMAVLGETSVREVIAFPTSSSGQTSIMDAPSIVPQHQLDELAIKSLSDARPIGGEAVYAAIIAKIERAGINNYDKYEHEPVYTSEDAAKIRDTSYEQGAKALVMYGDKKPLMVVVSGASKVDMKALKQFANIRDLRMATPEEVKKLTSLPIGAIPPFGSLFDLPTYVDEKLGENQQIAFNAGLHTKSIKMAYKDWLKAENPLNGTFSK